MNQHHIDTLEKHRHHYDTLRRDGVLPSIGLEARQEILQVVQEAINPGYITNLWCGACVADLVTYAYVQLDAYLTSKRLADGNLI